MNDQPRPEEDIVDQALAKPAHERKAFLDHACGADKELRGLVDGLMSAHEHVFENTTPFPGLQPHRPTPSATRPNQKPGDQISNYKLLEQIGEGGCGVVFVAEQFHPIRRQVALKVIKLGMDTQQVIARFEAERQALALMDHPNIAKVLDAGSTEHGRPFFVMELVKGIPITRYCDENKLSTEDRLKLFIQVCRATQHAHQKGIIHRDIKPSNILVTDHDGQPVPKMIDFGIAKATTDQRLTDKTVYTAIEQFLGTPAYMSPEQAKLSGLDIDTRSDIYSLGVLLYELLTSQTPFDAQRMVAAGLDEIRRIIREEDPVPPSTRISTLLVGEQTTLAAHRQVEPGRLVNQIRGDLDWIVMKCLEKDRRRRYETANGLVMDIQRHLESEPVLARPPSTLYQYKKFIRKHRLAVAVAAGFVLLLTAGVGVSSALAVKARRQTARALKAESVARTRAGDSEAILDFLENTVLAAPRPQKVAGGLGPDVTVKRAVEEAEPKVAPLFTNRPTVEARVRVALGLTFQYTGSFSNAALQFQRVNALFSSGKVPKDENYARNNANLSQAYLSMGRFHEALPLAELALKLMEQKLGADAAETLAQRNNLGNVYQATGKKKEALELYDQILKTQLRQLGISNRQTILTMANLGSVMHETGRKEDARDLLEKQLKAAETYLAPQDPLIAGGMEALAIVYAKLNQTNEAIQLGQKAVAFNEKWQPDHPVLFRSMNNLAALYLELGQPGEAVSLFEKTLELRTNKFGLEATDSLSSMDSLAEAYSRTGRFTNAEPLMIKTYEGWSKKDAEHSSPFTSLKVKEHAARLAKLYTYMGNTSQTAFWRSKIDLTNSSATNQVNPRSSTN